MELKEYEFFLQAGVMGKTDPENLERILSRLRKGFPEHGCGFCRNVQRDCGAGWTVGTVEDYYGIMTELSLAFPQLVFVAVTDSTEGQFYEYFRRGVMLGSTIELGIQDMTEDDWAFLGEKVV